MLLLCGCAYRPHPAPLTGGTTQFAEGMVFRTEYPVSWYHELGPRKLLPAQPTITWLLYAVNTNHPVYGPVAEWGIVHVSGTNAGTVVIDEAWNLTTNTTWNDIGTLSFSPTQTNVLLIPVADDWNPTQLFHRARLLTP